MNVLITGGGTQEPIDGVRALTNFSTGETARVIADYFIQAGATVTWLGAASSRQPKRSPHSLMHFQTFDDLAHRLEEELQNKKYNLVIHAAAVSDFRVVRLEIMGESFYPSRTLKLPSDQAVTLRLEPNYKILEKIKTWSRAPVMVVGFKLTQLSDPELRHQKVQKIFERGGVDYIVQNDLSEIDSASGRHHCVIWARDRLMKETWTKEELAQALWERAKEPL